MPSLRKIINTVCTYGFSVSANWWRFVCYKFQQQQLSKTILHSESRGNMKTLTLSLALHSICLCPVLWCVLHTGHHCTEELSHHTRSRWGAGPGRGGLNHGSILHNILDSGSITFLSQLKWAFYVISQHWGEKTIKKLDWQFFDDNTAFVAFKLFTQSWSWALNMKITLQYYNNNKHTYL